MKPKSALHSFLLTVGSSLLAVSSASADSATWNGTTDSSWATTTNWSASPVPGVGNTATFNNAGNGNTTITVGTISLTQVLFDTASAAAYTLGGGTITFANGTTTAVSVTSTVTANQTINANLTLGTAIASNTTFSNASTTGLLTLGGNITGGTGGTAAAKTLTFTGAGNITILGNISAGGATSLALDKRGAGTLTLSGATNSITGGDFAIGFADGNGGTVRIASGASVTTATAARLLLGFNTGQSGTFTMDAGAGTVTFGGNRGDKANYIGVDGGTGTVNANGGTLNFTGMANGSGHLLIGANGGTSNGTMTVAGGTVNVGTRIQMGSGYPGNNAAGWVANGNGNATLTISSGAVNIGTAGAGDTDSDKGVLYLKSPTGGTGTATVNLDGGTLSLARFVIGAGGTSRVVNFNGGTVQARASRTDFLGTGATLNVKDNGAVIDTNNFDITIAGNLVNSGAGGLTKLNTGTLTLTGANTYTGQTAINGGTLRVSGVGSLGTGAATVTGSGSVLDLNRNDTWGNHSDTTQALTIQSGGLVTNGTAINSGYNTVQTLALNGGELRVTGTARAVADGDLYKFEAYGIRNSVTVTGTTASSITNPGAITNAGINIGGFTDLGGGLGSNLTFNVADVTVSSAADLTVSAVLKNNYTAAFSSLSNGLVKTGGGTLVLSAANRYTGATDVQAGKLLINGTHSTSAGLITVSGTATLGGSGIMGDVKIEDGILAPGTSPGMITVGDLELTGAAEMKFELGPVWNGVAIPPIGSDYVSVVGDLTLAGKLTATPITGSFPASGVAVFGDKWLLMGYTGTRTGTIATLDTGALHAPASGQSYILEYDDPGKQVFLAVVPEPASAGLLLIGGLALRMLSRRRGMRT